MVKSLFDSICVGLFTFFFAGTALFFLFKQIGLTGGVDIQGFDVIAPALFAAVIGVTAGRFAHIVLTAAESG